MRPLENRKCNYHIPIDWLKRPVNLRREPPIYCKRTKLVSGTSYPSPKPKKKELLFFLLWFLISQLFCPFSSLTGHPLLLFFLFFFLCSIVRLFIIYYLSSYSSEFLILFCSTLITDRIGKKLNCFPVSNQSGDPE